MSLEPFNKLRFWVLGGVSEAMRKLGRSLDLAHVVTRALKPGHKQGNMRGAPAGKVAWPVDPDTHDGCSFIFADAFQAEYDAKKGEVYCVDDHTGRRHPGAYPLKVGRNVFIIGSETRGGPGRVVRSAEYGTAGLDKNIFQHYSPDLISHHLAPDQPNNSTLVHDPDLNGRAGGLHYLTRVRAMVRKFCSGATSAVSERLFAPMLNFTRNGDGTDNHGIAHFAKAEAALSAEAGGFAHPADDGNHRLGVTEEAQIHQGALELAETLFGSTPNGIVYSHVEFVNEQFQHGGKGPWPRRVEWREDFTATHLNYCGKPVRGEKRWQTWSDFIEFDPGAIKRPPTDDPGGVKADPGSNAVVPNTDPGENIKVPAPPDNVKSGPPRDPGTGDPPEGPGPGTGDPITGSPSAATPAEIEAPSKYAHPLPTGPEPPDRSLTGRNERETYWLRRYAVTDKRYAESAITGHRIATHVHESNTPADGPDRWPHRRSRDAIVNFDKFGNVVGRERSALGPGAVTEAAGGVEKHDLYTTINPVRGKSFDDFSFGVFSAFDDADSLVVADAEYGIGSRKPDTEQIIKGQAVKLDWNRLQDADNPDAVYTIRDEEGNDSTIANHTFKQTVQVTGGEGDDDPLDVSTETTGDNPRTRVFQARAASTNDTSATLCTFSLSTVGTYRIRATVMGRRTASTGGGSIGDSAGYELDATFKNVGGTVTQVGSTTQDAHEDASMASGDASFSISGTDVLLRVAGPAPSEGDDTFLWHMPWSRFGGPMGA